MAKVRYEIHVPGHARRIGIAAHHYVTQGPIKGIHSATVQYGHPYDSLVVHGEETPELDSHMKQTGAFIGELANVPFINVLKQGKNVAYWPIRNLQYQAQPSTAPPALDPVPGVAPLPSAGLAMAPATA